MNKTDLIQKSRLHKVFKPFYSGIGHALMFHRICDDNCNVISKHLQVTQEYLEEVIKFFISKNIDIVTLDECYNRISGNVKSKRFVTFTFDDGYADNLTHALPVFEKYNVPFSVFIATGFPDNTIVLWWYLLEKLVMNNDYIHFNFGINDYFYDTLTLDQKMNAYTKIKNFIQESSNQQDYLSRLKTIFLRNNVDMFELTKELSLSWKQVIELSNHPLVTIGAHTVNHFVLNKLTEKDVIEEISVSVSRIEKITGKPVSFFAYPFGSSADVGDREFNIAKDCNVKMAFTTEDDNIFRRHAHQLYSIPRIGIYESMRMSKIDLIINGLMSAIGNIL